jgi:hypothetical protein
MSRGYTALKVHINFPLITMTIWVAIMITTDG